MLLANCREAIWEIFVENLREGISQILQTAKGWGRGTYPMMLRSLRELHICFAALAPFAAPLAALAAVSHISSLSCCPSCFSAALRSTSHFVLEGHVPYRPAARGSVYRFAIHQCASHPAALRVPPLRSVTPPRCAVREAHCALLWGDNAQGTLLTGGRCPRNNAPRTAAFCNHAQGITDHKAKALRCVSSHRSPRLFER